MVEQTEQLVKLIQGTTSGRGKSTVRKPEFSYKRTANNYDYRFRLNSVVAKAAVSKDGEVLRVQLPSFRSCVGEQFLQVTLPALDAGTYDPAVGAKVISKCKLIHSDVAFEIDPELVWAILVGQCRNANAKTKRKLMFGSAAASAGAQTIVIPLLQPWSCHFSDLMYNVHGPDGTRNRGLFPAYAIKENIVWEITFRPRSHYSDGASGATAANGLENVTLMWEELVASAEQLAEIKKDLPLQVCAPDFTHLESQTNAGSETDYNITSLLSKSPTHTIWFNVLLNSQTDRDVFNKEQKVDLAELDCDGRTLVSDRDQNVAVRDYLEMINGKPIQAAGVQPQLPCICFGNDEGYSIGKSQQQISNTACNNVVLSLTCSAASTLTISAQHQRHYSIENGTIRSSNVY